MGINQRIKNAALSLMGRDHRQMPAGRALTVYPDDVFITSYPKSGNTWVRFLVSNLLYCKDGFTDFFNLAERIPSIYWECNDTLNTFPRPRVLKSHEYFDPRYPKVIYIVRDVRSVILSYYHFQLKRQFIKPEVTLSEFSKRFISGQVDNFGTWRENVTSWIKVRGTDHKRFCLIRYEDLKFRGKETLGEIASFLDIECSDSRIENALKMSSFSTMQQLERKYFEQNPEIAAGSERKQDIPVVRSGQTNSFKNVFNQESIDLIKTDCLDLLINLGYEW